MSNPSSIPLVAIQEFVASKQNILFKTLKQPRFTGKLTLHDTQSQSWTFYLFLGRLLYVEGGLHPVRRWRRNLAAHLPKIAKSPQLKDDLATIRHKRMAPRISAEYQLFYDWIQSGRTTRGQVERMIRSIFVEVFFDITQACQVTYEFQEDNTIKDGLVLVDAEQVIVQAWKEWQAWQCTMVSDRHPNSAPKIKFPDQLQHHSSAKTYEILTKLVDGRRTLRDLAVQLRKDVIQVTRFFTPYIQLGLIDLVDIPDLPSPFISGISDNAPMASPRPSDRILIAGVTASNDDHELLHNLLTDMQYDYLEIQDLQKAVAILLARRPKVIFLDLPDHSDTINSFNFCRQLKKLNLFRHTPIIVIQKPGPVFDRIRAKLHGVTDSLTRPFHPDQVQAIIEKHL